MQVNALQVRQSLGAILKKLASSGEPIVIEKNRTPVAVLISLEAFKERFIDYQDARKRAELLQRFAGAATPAKLDSLDVLRRLRYGSCD
jgi:PHD/YefM family antitoxin component YafN of YafNO toxin-antitoxin module